MNNYNNNVFRYERKFLLDKFTINSLADLNNYISTSFNENYVERKVNSIYYDKNNFSLAYENINGIYKRSKVRIRYYGNSDNLNLPKLEIKSKFGNVGKKDIFNLNSEEIYENSFSLSYLNNPKLLEYSQSNFLEFLNPVLRVSYKRNYFLSSCGRFRFTLDKDVNFKIFNKNNLYDSLNSENLIYLNKNILELKYSTNHESEAFRLVQKIPARLSTISKYLMALNYLGLITL